MSVNFDTALVLLICFNNSIWESALNMLCIRQYFKFKPKLLSQFLTFFSMMGVIVSPSLSFGIKWMVQGDVECFDTLEIGYVTSIAIIYDHFWFIGQKWCSINMWQTWGDQNRCNKHPTNQFLVNNFWICNAFWAILFSAATQPHCSRRYLIVD